eukprot:4875510-Pleurochrysis_carterae.AAC.6
MNATFAQMNAWMDVTLHIASEAYTPRTNAHSQRIRGQFSNWTGASNLDRVKTMFCQIACFIVKPFAGGKEKREQSATTAYEGAAQQKNWQISGHNEPRHSSSSHHAFQQVPKDSSKGS